MKKLFTLFTLVSTMATAQTSDIYGLLGVPFGCSKSVCDSIVLAKNKGRVIYQNEPNSICYTKISYSQWDNCLTLYKFNEEGKMYHAGVVIDVEKGDDMFQTYRDLRSLLSEKYGQPYSSFEYWKKPYDSDDENTYGSSALATGYVNFVAQWNNTDTDNIDTGRWLQLKLNNDKSIYIVADDMDLSRQLKESEKEKEKNDL